MDTLMAYDWPGNVRELENVIERAMILHRGESLRFDSMDSSRAGKRDVLTGSTRGEMIELDVLIRRHIQHVLDLTGGKIHGPGGAGEILGVNPSTLRYKMKNLGIPFRKGRKE